MKEKVAVFVDVQNVYYTTRQAFGRNFDYNTFWAHISEQGEITHAFAYAIYRDDEKQKQFQNILRAIGFDIRLKPFIQRSDGSAKGDWDVGITIDVLEYAPKVDRVVLVSGDGDFDLLIKRVIEKHGVHADVFGVAELTATSLIQSASLFTPIEGKFLL